MHISSVHPLACFKSSLDYLQHLVQCKCYADSCRLTANTSFAFWNFLNLKKKILLICSRLDQQMPNLWIQPSVWTSVTAPSVFPLSSKFTLEYLLWDDSLDSESVSPCSGSMLSSVRSGRWGASLPGPSAAAVLFSLAPAARTVCVQRCMCRACRHWGARSFRSGPAATSLCPAPPHRQRPLRAVHCSPDGPASPDLPLHAHLLTSHLGGLPQLWAPAEHTFSRAGCM